MEPNKGGDSSYEHIDILSKSQKNLILLPAIAYQVISTTYVCKIFWRAGEGYVTYHYSLKLGLRAVKLDLLAVKCDVSMKLLFTTTSINCLPSDFTKSQLILLLGYCVYTNLFYLLSIDFVTYGLILPPTV